MPEPVNVLIADDSPTMRQMLAGIVNAAPDLRLVGVASTGRQAVKLTYTLRPQVILMDLVMPDMDGLEATREIMRAAPTPIVVVSASLESFETDIPFQAIDAGALMVLRKPTGPQDPNHAAQAAELLNAARAMAGVRVIHHRKPAARPTSATVAAERYQTVSVEPIAPPKLVAIVASTGGPGALGQIMRQLPADFPLPVAIVQHIGPEFVSSLAGWLASTTPLQVVIAEQDDQPRPGSVYLAPGGAHLRLTANWRFELKATPLATPHQPSCDVFLESVAHCCGSQAVGIVLTGMGDDGARGLRAMYEAGAFTIAQDEATSIVYGMPRAALAMGAARLVLPLSEIPNTLVTLSRIGVHHETIAVDPGRGR